MSKIEIVSADGQKQEVAVSMTRKHAKSLLVAMGKVLGTTQDEEVAQATKDYMDHLGKVTEEVTGLSEENLDKFPLEEYSKLTQHIVKAAQDSLGFTMPSTK